MLKKFTLSLFAITLAVIVYDANYNVAHTNGGGAPAGHTGSPADNKTCNTSGCHTGGTVTDQEASITSDVPVAGYTPGATYTITATATKNGVNKFGFQLSPQDAGGNKLGTFGVAPAGTQLISSGKYLTHTSLGTAGSGTKTWSIQWTAPAAGTGTVNFYGAFNFTNSNNSSAGDIIKATTLAIIENTSIGINETDGGKEGFVIFPNPASDVITVSFFLYDQGTVTAEIFDISGRIVKKEIAENMDPGRHEMSFNVNDDLSSGVYFIRLNDGKESYTRKTVIK